MHLAQAHRLHLLLRPRDRPLVRGRVGQARADRGDQVVEGFEDLRALHAFGADLLDHAEVDAVLRRSESGGRALPQQRGRWRCFFMTADSISIHVAGVVCSRTSHESSAATLAPRRPALVLPIVETPQPLASTRRPTGLAQRGSTTGSSGCSCCTGRVADALLSTARAAVRCWPAAWGFACGMGYTSFFSELENLRPHGSVRFTIRRRLAVNQGRDADGGWLPR